MNERLKALMSASTSVGDVIKLERASKNNNIPKRKKQSAVNLQANAIVRADEADARLTYDNGQPMPTAEEWRQFKIMEALNERRKIDRLRAQAEEARLEERRRKY